MNTRNQNQFTQTPIIQTASEKATLEYRLGFLAYATGNKDQALEHFQIATIAKPSYIEAQRWLGRVALELGLGSEAQRAFETVLRFQGQNSTIMGLLEFARNVNLYGLESAQFFRAGCQQTDQTEQIDLFQKAAAANPAHQQAWAWLGRLLLETRDYDATIVACRKALILDPDDAGSAHRLQLALRNTKLLIPLKTFSVSESVGNASTSVLD